MLPRWALALFLLCLFACGGAVSNDDTALGLGDWSLSYVDAGSYYGSGSTNTDDDASVAVDPPDDAGAMDSTTAVSDSSTDAADASALAPH